MSKTILVTGDIIRDIYIYQGDRIFPAQQGKIAPYCSDQVGGARGLFEMIKAVHSGQTEWGLQYPLPNIELQSVHALWIACEGGTKEDQEESAKNDKPKKVWRVGQSLGYALGMSGLSSLTTSDAAKECHSVVVVDDAGLAFRTQPSAHLWPVGIKCDQPQPELIIHKMTDLIAQGDLWRALIGGDAPAPRGNLIVIISAEDLRRSGAAISRGFSWERTLSELCDELNHNPIFQPLLRFPSRLIVNFDCVATVWFDSSDEARKSNHSAHERATLMYDPTLPEDGWKTRLADTHAVYGHLNTFTAAIAVAAAEKPIATSKELDDAIRRGLVACRQLRLLGHGLVSAPVPAAPISKLVHLLSPTPSNSAQVKEDLKKLTPLGLQKVTGACGNTCPTGSETWTLAASAENPPDQPHLPLYGLAHRVALYGYTALQHIPHAYFGALLSVDRSEMETLRSLTQLIQRYEEVKQQKQPLSIGAFGPPGAGKSFGVIQIAKAVLNLTDENILIFNLSQFSEPSDLFGAFHQVRDKALKGVTPLVFWDEFDSRDYKWLQYLLAPMQDGAFEEHGHTHAIGKCVFVFAGATSWDFKHFGPAPLPGGWKPLYDVNIEEALKCEDQEVKVLAKRYHGNRTLQDAEAAARADFCRKKGPDFLSRLDGHIDVLGPNPRLGYDWETCAWTVADPNDITFPIRRALLLRQFLGAKKPKDKIEIDRDLLRAFIHVLRYRHGVRSLEKIARHLAPSRSPFRRANLPPPQVLIQHIEPPEDFDRIYHEAPRLLTPPTIDALADAINEGYNNDNPAPYNKAFKDLNAFLQQSNRAAALRIPHILALAGLNLRIYSSQRPKLNQRDPLATKKLLDAPLSPDEQAVFNHLNVHIEVLAEEEHRLWIQFHEENGWTFGFKMKPKAQPSDPDEPVTPYEKDKANLLHPCIKPFHEMPDEYGQRKTWQDYDRNAILRYPRILRLTEFEIAFAKV